MSEYIADVVQLSVEYFIDQLCVYSKRQNVEWGREWTEF